MKAPAIDPVFAAIAEHKARTKESNRLEAANSAARAKAEKRYGKWTRAPNPHEWPGEAITNPFYDRWMRGVNAERKAAMRMARTTPTTPGGIAAMINHARRALKTGDEVDWLGWVRLALKTAAGSCVGCAQGRNNRQEGQSK